MRALSGRPGIERPSQPFKNGLRIIIGGVRWNEISNCSNPADRVSFRRIGETLGHHVREPSSLALPGSPPSLLRDPTRLRGAGSLVACAVLLRIAGRYYRRAAGLTPGLIRRAGRGGIRACPLLAGDSGPPVFPGWSFGRVGAKPALPGGGPSCQRDIFRNPLRVPPPVGFGRRRGLGRQRASPSSCGPSPLLHSLPSSPALMGPGGLDLLSSLVSIPELPSSVWRP